MSVKEAAAVKSILQSAAENVTRLGDFDLADHLRDLADDYAYPQPVVVVGLPEGDWREAER